MERDTVQSATRPDDHQDYGLPHPLKLCALFVAMIGLAIATTLASATEETGASVSSGVAGVQRNARLVHFVRQECGSCHGLTLNGGLGPALTSTALAGKPVPYLKSVILYGRNGTAMPPWYPLLTEAEAAWIAERLLAGFPDAR